jgi:hypothetical protein
MAMRRSRNQSGRAALAIVAAVGIGCSDEVGMAPTADVEDAADVAADALEDESVDVSNEPPGEDVPDGGEDAARDAGEAGDAADVGMDVAEVGVDVAEVGMDAPPDAREAGVDAGPDAREAGLDAAPDAREAGVDAGPDAREAGLDAAPDVREAGVDASPDVRDAPDAPPAWGLDTRPRNATCVAFARPTEGTGVTLTRVFPSLPAGSSVVGLLQAPGAAGRWYVVEQAGRVFAFNNSATVAARTSVVDIRSRVQSGGELGLLGMAFHPSFATNGQVFLSYTGAARAGRSEAAVSRLSRFRSADGGATIDPASEQILLEISSPTPTTTAAHIAFGPDGLLYYGMGDGGSGARPDAQRAEPQQPAREVLRIDVNRTRPGARTASPPTTPSRRAAARPRSTPGACATPGAGASTGPPARSGRATWGRARSRRSTSSSAAATTAGTSWRARAATTATTCNRTGLILPVTEYGRSLGVSITGGYVYRGSRVPWLVGSFLFADFQSGRVWRVAHDAMGAASAQQIASSGINVSTFGEGVDGEVYVVNHGDGRVDRVDPGPTTPTDTVPRRSARRAASTARTRCSPRRGSSPTRPTRPSGPTAPTRSASWPCPTAGASRSAPTATGTFPVGTVLVKNFTHMGRRIETRLMVRHADGDWAGYTYRGTTPRPTPTLVRGSDARDLPGGLRWYYPSRAECMECHTTAAGRTLGLETAQLNGEMRYPQPRAHRQPARHPRPPGDVRRAARDAPGGSRAS